MPSRGMKNAGINCQVLGGLLLLGVALRLFLWLKPGTLGLTDSANWHWYELVVALASGIAYFRWGDTILEHAASFEKARRNSLLLTGAWLIYWVLEFFRGARPQMLTLIMLVIVLVSLLRAAEPSAESGNIEPGTPEHP